MWAWSDEDSIEKGAQKIGDPSQEAEQLAEIETCGGQQCVRAIPCAAFEPVAAQQSVVFRVSYDRFDHRATFEPTFDFIGDAPRLCPVMYALPCADAR